MSTYNRLVRLTEPAVATINAIRALFQSRGLTSALAVSAMSQGSADHGINSAEIRAA
jgi:hypothetical protein